MNFGEAIAALKRGAHVARAGWNGKGMYLYLVDGNSEGRRSFDPAIYIYTAQGTHQPGWLASQADMLADDWRVESS